MKAGLPPAELKGIPKTVEGRNPASRQGGWIDQYETGRSAGYTALPAQRNKTASGLATSALCLMQPDGPASRNASGKSWPTQALALRCLRAPKWPGGGCHHSAWNGNPSLCLIYAKWEYPLVLSTNRESTGKGYATLRDQVS